MKLSEGSPGVKPGSGVRVTFTAPVASATLAMPVSHAPSSVARPLITRAPPCDAGWPVHTGACASPAQNRPSIRLSMLNATYPPFPPCLNPAVRVTRLIGVSEVTPKKIGVL